MTKRTRAAIDTALAGARAGYAARLLSKVAELSAFAARREWREMRSAAHKLRGSAATYGFREVGDAAGHVEDLILEANGSPDDDARARIQGLLAAAEGFARAAAAGASGEA